MKQKQPGRPKVKDKTKSFTVCIKMSHRNRLVKQYGSLSKAIKTL